MVSLLRSFLPALLLGLMILSFLNVGPEVVSAQTGIVPACPANDPDCENPYAPENYGFCEVVSTFSNVLGFAISALGVIAVLIVVYVGFLYITALGNPGTIARGKQMFINVVVGFVIALSAYLVVNTILSVLVGQNNSFLQWGTIECVYEYETGDASYELNIESQSADSLILDAGADILVGSAGADIFNNPLSGVGVCNSSLLGPVFGSQAAAAACIARAESGCGAQFYSSTDRDADGVPFSVSAWQINLTVHEVVGCGQTLDCKSAYSGRNYSAHITNRSLYNACVQALSNPQCAAINARRIQQTSGWSAWSTAGQCGL